jgi:hypothetical protein
MKRVMTTVVLSWLLATAGGCCCPGPYLHAVGSHVFGPWRCGHRYHGGCGCGHGHHQGCCQAPCGDPCGYDEAGFAGGCGYGPGHGHCGDAAGYGGPGYGCCDQGCGECSWYNTGCNSCCGCWGCGDVYLTDLFHPICDPCWRRGRGRRHGLFGHGCCGCQDYQNTCAPGYSHVSYDGGPCGGACGDCGPYASAPQRGAWMADGSSISGPLLAQAQAPRTPPRTQAPRTPPRTSANRAMVAQATRAPWETPTPPRSQWVMNKEYVVSQPKVVDDRVVESRPKVPEKKMAQAGSGSGSASSSGSSVNR